MSVRRRITWLLAIFGLYAVFTAAAAVYGNQWRLERASLDLQRIASQTTRIDELELYLMEQLFLLRQLAGGQPQAATPYGRVREKWTTVLHDAVAFSAPTKATAYASSLRALAEDFETASNQCLELAGNSRLKEAARIVNDKLANDIVPQIEQELAGARLALAEAMNASARGLAATSLQMLSLTLGVALLAAVLVTAGAALVHRWLIRPITQLQTAVHHFRRGDLSYRNSLSGSDELGDLGEALNEMAQTVSASGRKHRTLFSNLRDAVVICDANGIIQEYHDGDTQILGVEEARHLGGYVLDVWPEWKRTAIDWPQVIRSAAEDGRRLRLHDVQLDAGVHGSTSLFADFVVYSVECGDVPCAAVVVRDVTQRHQLQDRLRQAETMEALGTMAGGLAHDVSNLLSSVTGTLSVLVNELREPAHKAQIQTALRACKRAGGLSKRLLDFARGVQGTPQVFAPAEIIDAIVESGDLPSSESVSIQCDLDHQIRVRMDPD